jgi:nucleoside-diphosphate-sugar epimerase
VSTGLRIALTGATGFVGGEVLAQAMAAKLPVNALTRRPQDIRPDLRWVSGALNSKPALVSLMRDADMVLHVAGVVNAADRAGFHTGNVAGTRAMVDAARAAGVRRFVHVSSLAAREPELSDYGWSKARAEQEVMASGLDWTIVRPPAVYGPADKEMLELFKLAARGILPLPPSGRLSVIHVADLARLLIKLTCDGGENLGQVYEADDGVAKGWSHRDFARAIAEAVGKRALTVAVPRPMLDAAAWIDKRMRGPAAKLTADRVAFFCHPDWTVDDTRRPPEALWTPGIETRAGLRETTAAYRAKAWLKR